MSCFGRWTICVVQLWGTEKRCLTIWQRVEKASWRKVLSELNLEGWVGVRLLTEDISRSWKQKIGECVCVCLSAGWRVWELGRPARSYWNIKFVEYQRARQRPDCEGLACLASTHLLCVWHRRHSLCYLCNNSEKKASVPFLHKWGDLDSGRVGDLPRFFCCSVTKLCPALCSTTLCPGLEDQNSNF